MLNRRNLILIAIGYPILAYLFLMMLGREGFEVFFFLFLFPGLFGVYVIGKKGYLTGISILLLLLVGWWALIVLASLGSITILLAAILPERRRCSHCHELISKKATRCPKCQGDLTVKPQSA